MSTHLDYESFKPSIWNPKVAARLSLIFTPAFGSYLQMRNWRELGEPEREQGAKLWLIASIVVLLAQFTTAFEASSVIFSAVVQLVNFVFLIVWYYRSAKPHTVYVQSKYGGDYSSRGWLRPLAVALVVYLSFVGLACAVGLTMALVNH